MADWDTTAVEYAAYVSEWVEEYGIDFLKSVSNEEMTQEQHDMLVELNKNNLVWTEHGTCEDSMYTPGFRVIGDCSLLDQKAGGCGCWQSYAYHIGTAPWIDENESVLCTVYIPCEVCNPEGEAEDFPDGCPGPETPVGADRGDCEEGFVHWYFD
jgi:hypothetical protein